MSHNDRRTRPSADPHGYQPIVINEDCLSAEDCREELMDSLSAIADPCKRNRSRDIKSVMTPEELEVYERPPTRDSPFRIGNVSIEQEEERYAISRLANLRVYSREKYGDGQRIWYGDGVPFGERGG